MFVVPPVILKKSLMSQSLKLAETRTTASNGEKLSFFLPDLQLYVEI